MNRRTVLLGSLGFVFPGAAVESTQPERSPQKRYALVLANEAYENKALTNVLNDARAISRTLQQLGFDVISCLDQTRSGMFSALRTFRDKLTPGCIALVYYSGHGAQVGGENYLIPVNNRGLEKASDLPDEAIPLVRILDALGKSDGQLNLIILDACRDNPFQGAKSLGGDKGLAVVSRSVSGTLIAFAAGPGEVASSNPSGKNSLFTEELVKNLPKPGLRLEDVFLTTRKAVRERSGGKQIPQEYGSLESVVFLAGGATDRPETNNISEIKLSATAIRLELLGVPTGAKVLIDDAVLSGTIYTDDIAEKTKVVEVSVSAAGFRPYVGMVTLTRGSTSTLRVTMKPMTSESIRPAKLTKKSQAPAKEKPAAPKPAPTPAPAKELGEREKAVVGKYTVAGQPNVIELTNDGGSLTMQTTGYPTLPVELKADDALYNPILEGQVELKILRDSERKPNGISLTYQGITVRFQKEGATQLLPIDKHNR